MGSLTDKDIKSLGKLDRFLLAEQYIYPKINENESLEQYGKTIEDAKSKIESSGDNLSDYYIFEVEYNKTGRMILPGRENDNKKIISYHRIGGTHKLIKTENNYEELLIAIKKVDFAKLKESVPFANRVRSLFSGPSPLIVLLDQLQGIINNDGSQHTEGALKTYHKMKSCIDESKLDLKSENTLTKFFSAIKFEKLDIIKEISKNNQTDTNLLISKS